MFDSPSLITFLFQSYLIFVPLVIVYMMWREAKVLNFNNQSILTPLIIFFISAALSTFLLVLGSGKSFSLAYSGYILPMFLFNPLLFSIFYSKEDFKKRSRAIFVVFVATPIALFLFGFIGYLLLTMESLDFKM